METDEMSKRKGKRKRTEREAEELEMLSFEFPKPPSKKQMEKLTYFAKRQRELLSEKNEFKLLEDYLGFVDEVQKSDFLDLKKRFGLTLYLSSFSAWSISTCRAGDSSLTGRVANILDKLIEKHPGIILDTKYGKYKIKMTENLSYGEVNGQRIVDAGTYHICFVSVSDSVKQLVLSKDGLETRVLK